MLMVDLKKKKMSNMKYKELIQEADELRDRTPSHEWAEAVTSGKKPKKGWRL